MKCAGIVRHVLMVAFFVASALAQDSFVGRWQAKISPASGKPSITVNIVGKQGQLEGTVVLVDGFDGSETQSRIMKPELSGRTLKFETNIKDATFSWELTLKQGGQEGQLHGSYGHMLIDERVVNAP